jgi:fibronectin type 3 domain-containing protein
VATDAEIPSNLKITQPGKTGLSLSWGAVANAEKYKVYRSTNGTDYSYLGEAASVTYQDTAVAAGSSYYYAVSAVVNGLETGKSVPVFGFAEAHFALPVFAERRLLALKGWRNTIIASR